MDLTRLAASQKRIQDWQRFADSGVPVGALKAELVHSIAQYRRILNQCWEDGEDRERALTDAERRIGSLYDAAHLAPELRNFVPGKS